MLSVLESVPVIRVPCVNQMEHWECPWNSLRSPVALKWGILNILNLTLCTVSPNWHAFICEKKAQWPFYFPCQYFSHRAWWSSWLKPNPDVLADWLCLSVLGSGWKATHGSLCDGVSGRRSSGYNEVPLVLWKLDSLGWDSRQICTGLRLAKQVHLVLPDMCSWKRDWNQVQQLKSHLK